ncbi:hypothetical protein EXE53_16510 [Halorubrum sp. SD626R]|nr:hypothetical protein EXE53_16510 [Halorubrum sp. SD626R]
MDSDSPVTMRIAGQPTCDLGTAFTAGNTRKRFTGARRAACGFDSARRPLGYRGSSASYRLPLGQGYRP